MTMAERLCRAQVAVLHGRRVPGCPARIDHLAIGPGGLTVVGAGPVRGRDPFALRDLVTAVERHVELIRACLAQWGAADVDVRGCLCPDDLHGAAHRFAGLGVRDVPLLDAAGAARLAARPGPLSPARVERLTDLFAAALPAAPQR
jgi:hypothetical protein